MITRQHQDGGNEQTNPRGDQSKRRSTNGGETRAAHPYCISILGAKLIDEEDAIMMVFLTSHVRMIRVRHIITFRASVLRPRESSRGAQRQRKNMQSRGVILVLTYHSLLFLIIASGRARTRRRAIASNHARTYAIFFFRISPTQTNPDSISSSPRTNVRRWSPRPMHETAHIRLRLFIRLSNPSLQKCDLT